MPGVLHQGILTLFRRDPWLAFDLLGLERPGSGTPVDRRTEVEAPTEDPTKVDTGLPDLVLVSVEPEHDEGGVAICVEAQVKVDRTKRYRIPLYHGAVANAHQLPTWVVFISFSSAMSQAIRAWSKGSPPRVDVLLLDADTVSMSASLELARPTAAVLVGALHARRGDLDAARLAIAACRELPKDIRTEYHRIILAAVTEPRRKIIEKELPVEDYDPLWEIERESSPYVYGVRDGREQGRAEGVEQGRRETLVDLILAVAEVRGFALDDQWVAPLRACASLPRLQRWARAIRDVADPRELLLE